MAAAAAGAEPASDKLKNHLRPHELIPEHIKSREKIDARKALMKAAASELGDLRSTLEGEAWSLEVLCAKILKRKTLYCCTADPQKPDRRPIRPLDILCEAKVSAASPTFIKCSCEACTGGASSYSGGSFSSVPDFLAHGRSIFGPETVVVLAELELSWPELLDLLKLDPTDHMWYCLFCEETIPSAPLRTCDGCQLACHGACYVRAYGQPLAPGASSAAAGGKGLDTRVLCVSCQDPELQTLQELQTVKIGGSKAGTARYTVPPLPHEVFRRETQPSHFTKGTYDFWGNNQAKLMDALVFKLDTPEAQAAAEAVAASEAAAAAAAAEGGDPAAAAAGGDAAAPVATAVEQQQEGEAATAAAAAGDDAAQQQEEEPPHDPAHKATHVLIVRDPGGRILTVPYEYGKNHKTHGPNRKLWVIKLMSQLGLHQSDLLVATKEPFEFKPLAVRQAEALRQQQWQPQPDGPYMKVLNRCDKVLQLHIIKKGCKPAATQGNASARAAAFMAANTAAAGPRSKAGPLAVAAGAAGAGPAAQRQQQQSRSGVTANTPQSQSGSRAADDDGESGDAAGDADYAPGTGHIPAPAAVQGAPPAKPGQAKRTAAAAFQKAPDAMADVMVGHPAYKIVQQQRHLQQQQLRYMEEERLQREQAEMQKQRMQQRTQERQSRGGIEAAPVAAAAAPPAATAAAAAAALQDAVAAASEDAAAAAEEGEAEQAAQGRKRGGGRGSRGGRGGRGGRGSRGRGRGRGKSKAADSDEDDGGGSDSDYAAAEVAAALGARGGTKWRQSAAARRSVEAVASTQVSADDGMAGQRGAGGSGDAEGWQQGEDADADYAPGSRAAAAAAGGSGRGKRQRKAHSATGAADEPMQDAAVGGADGGDAVAIQLGAQVQQLESSNQQLQHELADARQQVQSLQQQLQAAQQQRDAAVAERDKSQLRYRQLVQQMDAALGDDAAAAAGGDAAAADNSAIAAAVAALGGVGSAIEQVVVNPEMGAVGVKVEGGVPTAAEAAMGGGGQAAAEQAVPVKQEGGPLCLKVEGNGVAEHAEGVADMES